MLQRRLNSKFRDQQISNVTMVNFGHIFHVFDVKVTQLEYLWD